MNTNDLDNFKKNLAKKLLSGENLTEKLQENSSPTEYIKYRTSTPWTTLTNASKAVGGNFTIVYNQEKRTKFDITPLQAQAIFDASFLKALRYLSDELEVDEFDFRDDLVKHLLGTNILRKSFFEIIEKLRKLRIESFEDI